MEIRTLCYFLAVAREENMENKSICYNRNMMRFSQAEHN